MTDKLIDQVVRDVGFPDLKDKQKEAILVLLSPCLSLEKTKLLNRILHLSYRQ